MTREKDSLSKRSRREIRDAEADLIPSSLADSPFAKYSIEEIRSGAANEEVRKHKRHKPLCEAADNAVQEELATVQVRQELQTAVGISAELLVPSEMTAVEFQTWKRAELRKRVAAIARQASAHYPVLPSDKAAFEQLAYSEFLLECVLERIVRKGLLNNMPPVGDAKYSEGMLLMQVFKDLSRQIKEQRTAALLTRSSRQNQLIAQDRQDTFEFMAAVRRGILQKAKSAIDVEVINDKALQTTQQ